MGTYPAYGYKRDPADKHHLVIDEDTAPIVRRIFEMRAAGTGFHAIAVILNEEGMLLTDTARATRINTGWWWMKKPPLWCGKSTGCVAPAWPTARLRRR